MKHSAKLAALAVLLVASWPAAPVMAQAVYGSIAGTVLDSTGAAVPGANVTITSLERKTSDTVVSNESGFYAKERLLPGNYEVRAELTGFKQAVISPVRVSIDSQTKIDFRLELGQMTEAVTVTAAEGQLLKTDRADVATSFDTKQLTEMPNLDRNFTKVILLTPGTQSLQWQHAASENPQGSNQTMVNGQHFSGTGYQLDGTENRDPILGIIVINPNLEAIGEAKITSQNYDAEFGQATAGVVSVQTKSGTNELHGSAFEFYQSDRFQARNPFTQPENVPLPETSKHQFGAAIGGPIQSNKWFFFADYQGLRSKVGGSQRLTVPTARARTGDLSEYGVNIYDPLTGRQFPGNVIPANRLSPQALAILRLLPNPTGPGIRDNYIKAGSETFDGNSGDVRIDGRLSDRLNVFARYSIADFVRNGPTAFDQAGGAALVSLGGVSDVTNHSVAAGFDYTLSSTSILDVRFGFFKYGVEVLPFDYQVATARDAGIPGLNFDDFSSGLPMMRVQGDFEFKMGSGLDVNRCNCPLSQHEKQAQIVSNFTKILGNHTVKVGVDIRRAWNLRVPSDAHRSGQLDFSPDRTSLNGQGGLGLATFLLGDVTFFERYVSPTTDARERQWRQFYYVQDTWRATSKLTLNYGLRLEMINPQTVNAAGNGGWLDLNTGEILVGGVGDVNLAGNMKNALNWAPRLGVTYQLNEKTVIRAGYGRSYDIGVFGSTFGHSVTQNLPVLSFQQLNRPSQFDRVFNLAQGPPPPVFITPPASGRFRLPNGVSARALAQDADGQKQRLPSVDAYNLTVQRQITNNTSIEIGYVGNKGTHVFAGDGPAFNVNEPTLVGYPNVPLNNRRPFFAGPIGAMNGGRIGGPFGWTQGIDFFCNCADNRYDSLQTKLTRRFADGWSVQAHYTLQRVRHNGGSQFFFDRDLERGRADWDRIHNFALTGLAELPFGKGRRFLSDASGLTEAILGGWQINTAILIQSGLPFNVEYGGAGGDRDTGPNRPDLIAGADPMAGGGSKDRWFNATPIGESGSAFSRPAPGTFGNLPRNYLTGPGYWRVDASLFKRFAIGSRANLELRLEAINVLNHVNLGNPDSTIGSPGNPRPNAGRITSTAYFGADPQRNLQFAARFIF